MKLESSDHPHAAPLLRTIAEVRAMIGSQHLGELGDTLPADGHALLQQCLALCESPEIDAEPVRTVHHMACTGGTAISKCIAAMPNVLLLSEVDPLSPLVGPGAAPKFTPTDITALLRWSTRDVGRETLIRLFEAQVVSLRATLAECGRHLVLRDHAHSHFCTGPAVPHRQSLRDMVQAVCAVRSVVTARNPFDSFASLTVNKWLHFEPATFEEYCRRYLAFLDRHQGVPIFRFEDIVTDPQNQLRVVCEALELSFTDTFVQTFSAFRLSGDSGRRSDELRPQPRREAAIKLESTEAGLPVARELLARLGYLQPA